ncbi:MAG TPA: Hsp70 family protein, partial [Nitrospiraceae bacterium]
MRRLVGLDFGTTNSAIAVAEEDGSVRLAKFQDGDRLVETFRSILYFFHPFDQESGGRYVAAGPAAIEAYLKSDPRGRLIQSLKSFLASRSFTKTALYRSFYKLEDLIGLIIQELRSAAEAQFGDLEPSVVVGRPVRFSGAATQEDDYFASERLRRAVQQAGFEQVYFEYEPVAAAYRYERELDHDELVLIADFGGGTSDFSLLPLGPSMRSRRQAQRDILGTDGVAIAGNDFDSALIRNLVAPELGLGAEYLSHNKRLPVPP